MFPRLWLGPMAGYSDSAMRRLCHKMGAEASISEMISAKAVVYRDKKTVPLGHIGAEEGKVFLQLFGKEPEILAEAAAMLAQGYCGEKTPYGIDLNAGCPVPKIAGNGEGSALMKDPDLCCRIAGAMRKALPKEMPLSAKIRLGWDENSKNAAEVAQAFAEGGCDLLFVHGRTRTAMYAGEADWEGIAAVAEAVHIPVIGNGDIRTPDDAGRRLDGYGVFGIMIARGAVGNPFLFARIRAVLEGKDPPPPPTKKERADAALLQLSYTVEDKGERVAVLECRKQLAAYFAGEPGSAALRKQINEAETFARVRKILSSFCAG